jgi:hypothetical protein
MTIKCALFNFVTTLKAKIVGKLLKAIQENLRLGCNVNSLVDIRKRVDFGKFCTNHIRISMKLSLWQIWFKLSKII